MIVVFARHGESEANVLDVFSTTGSKHGLTENGREQARALAEKLLPEGITRIYASPLLRAQETAAIVGERLGLPVATEPALREFSVGEHEGKYHRPYWDEYVEVQRQWLIEGNRTARFGGGECLNDIANRFLPFVHGLIDQYGETDERVLLIGHGGVFATVLPDLLANVSHAFAESHPFGQASYVRSHLEDGHLVCDRWGDATDFNLVPSP